MGRNLSPLLRRELANLDKDADSRKTAMKVLKSYVKDLDSMSIPLFLAQVSETKEPGSSSGEYIISLYEVLARVHGTNIAPQIDNIMATIINTLRSSAGSFPLHQACSKVVPAIARYGIDPSTTEDKKRRIIHSLCKPLSDSLLGSQEGLASGAALCLKALVESDNWRFASDEYVNEVCLRVAGALEEKPTQTGSHLGLAMALAKHNSLVVEAYARSLIRSALRILNAGVAEANSQKRLLAIHMVNFLIKCLDSRSIFSELGIVIEEMEKCQSDQMAYVSGAAFEALQTARRIGAEKGLRFEKDAGSMTGSNFGRRDYAPRTHLWSAGDRSPVFASPESQTVNSFFEYDSLAESPMSMRQVSCHFDYGSRSVNRKLWRNENGLVDVSLKDGLFSEMGMPSNISKNKFERYENSELSDNGDHLDGFSGFLQPSPSNGATRITTPSPQRSHSQLNIDNIKIFTTPRKLIRTLQDPNDVNSDFSEKQTRRFRSPAMSQLEWSPRRNSDRNGFFHDLNHELKGYKNPPEAAEEAPAGSESVSSTGNVPADVDPEVSREVSPEVQSLSIKRRNFWKSSFNLVCGVFMFLGIMMSVMLIGDQEEGSNLVPT
ncbi:hypothetical protein HHK36_012103 [Tetracentron sinense]|uniref:TORTIFOLIA1/SINE1-2 N-terminal domain-containing protein n=1 Tax=Tetracentron sinense TaxID=13715 RepID=A0A835DHU6_TETSI|nr:hypothetical protein HHK36_012103 [Tetracentron sinense]